MRISDWSLYVCSSDLAHCARGTQLAGPARRGDARALPAPVPAARARASAQLQPGGHRAPAGPDAAWPQRAVPAGAAALAACAGVPAGRLPAPGARAPRLPVGVRAAVCGLDGGDVPRRALAPGAGPTPG